MLTDEQGRDYLLGRLPETDAESLENRMLQDEELFVTLRSIEDDLFDDLARGALSDAERHAFLQRYNDPARIAFARALARRGPNVTAMPARRWMAWGAAAAAIIVVGLAAIFSRTPESQSTTTARVVAPVARTVAVNIALATSRSAGQAQQIALPRDASALLQIRLDPQDRFDSYTVALTSRANIWQAGNLHAVQRNGDLILSAVVPASQLPEGSYELAVRGGDEDLGFVTVEVHRTP